MIKLHETITFTQWLNDLKDRRARAKIVARLQRLINGLAGDVEPVGEGISELRIHYGKGYRVYFKRSGESIIIIFCGGDKSSQSKDIKKAKLLARELIE